MVGPAYKKRVLPLAWQVLPFGSTSSETQINLLKRLEKYILRNVRVIVNFEQLIYKNIVEPISGIGKLGLKETLGIEQPKESGTNDHILTYSKATVSISTTFISQRRTRLDQST